tara:strand:- start:914 stop:1387 length:474 start_codon:yes stop_codon:yes gene_type:complete
MDLLSKKVIKKLIKKKIKISVAESCTGGMISGAITSVSGSSKVFNLGLVTYSNESKINILNISKKIIKKYGAVSEQVCKYMTVSVSKIGKSNMSIATTGIAGPGGSTKNKPIGLVYIGIKKANKISINKCLFKNKGRSYIQKKTVNKCLRLALGMLK